MRSLVRARAPHLMLLVPALATAAMAMAVSDVIPLLGPLLLSLIVGAVVANTPLMRHDLFAGQAQLTKSMLRWGIVLLGLRISAVNLFDVGLPGLIVAMATVAATYAFTSWFGRRLRMDHDLVALVAAGFSICGAAAIAAVSDAARAKQRHVGLAVALVTIYGSLMIVILPPAASALGLTDKQAAVWAGASIHEVAQVIAAASLVGSSVVVVATTVKLARVLLLAPVYVLATKAAGDPIDSDKKLPLLPWFVAGFIAAVGIRSTGILSSSTLDVANHATTALLAAGMFGLGLGIRIKEIWPVPPAALALATASTVVAAGTSLVLVAAFV